MCFMMDRATLPHLLDAHMSAVVVIASIVDVIRVLCSVALTFAHDIIAFPQADPRIIHTCFTRVEFAFFSERCKSGVCVLVAETGSIKADQNCCLKQAERETLTRLPIHKIFAGT
jgi:hypothetical protein